MRIKIVHSRTWYHGSEKKTAAIMLHGKKSMIFFLTKYPVFLHDAPVGINAMWE